MIDVRFPLKLKTDAEIALANGDYMKAMDLFADAAEQALELGLQDLSNEYAAKVVEIIRLMSETNNFD